MAESLQARPSAANDCQDVEAAIVGATLVDAVPLSPCLAPANKGSVHIFTSTPRAPVAADRCVLARDAAGR